MYDNDYNGYVYLLETYDGYTKIGYTHRNVYHRFEENNYQYDEYKFSDVYCYFFTDKPMYYENKIHKMLSKYRIKGTEIFRISPPDVEELIELKYKKLYNGLCSKDVMNRHKCEFDKYDDITKLKLDELDKKIYELNYIYNNYEKYKNENISYNSKIDAEIILLEQSVNDNYMYLCISGMIAVPLTILPSWISVIFWGFVVYFYFLCVY